MCRFSGCPSDFVRSFPGHGPVMVLCFIHLTITGPSSEKHLTKVQSEHKRSASKHSDRSCQLLRFLNNATGGHLCPPDYFVHCTLSLCTLLNFLSLPAELYPARRTVIREANIPLYQRLCAAHLCAALLHLLPGEGIGLVTTEDEDLTVKENEPASVSALKG